MSQSSHAHSERVFELLAAETLGQLTVEEAAELATLSSQFSSTERESLEVAAAAALLALAPHDSEPLPGHLQQRIASAAQQYVHIASATRPIVPAATPPLRESPLEGGMSRRETLAWLAAAAAVAFAAYGWLARPSEVAQHPAAEERRSWLVDHAGDLVTMAWGPGNQDYGDAGGGDVVWSPSRQEGYMRFVGLPKNDAARQQYQLWIIDPARDEKPVDGGVFDIVKSGEVIVPISARLPVGQPAAFAVTIEKPGGVVVSTQEKVALLAKP